MNPSQWQGEKGVCVCVCVGGGEGGGGGGGGIGTEKRYTKGIITLYLPVQCRVPQLVNKQINKNAAHANVIQY